MKTPMFFVWDYKYILFCVKNSCLIMSSNTVGDQKPGAAQKRIESSNQYNFFRMVLTISEGCTIKKSF